MRMMMTTTDPGRLPPGSPNSARADYATASAIASRDAVTQSSVGRVLRGRPARRPCSVRGHAGHVVPIVAVRGSCIGFAGSVGRIFVVERAGRIRIVDANGQLLPEPFLDLTNSRAPTP